MIRNKLVVVLFKEILNGEKQDSIFMNNIVVNFIVKFVRNYIKKFFGAGRAF